MADSLLQGVCHLYYDVKCTLPKDNLTSTEKLESAEWLAWLSLSGFMRPASFERMRLGGLAKRPNSARIRNLPIELLRRAETPE